MKKARDQSGTGLEINTLHLGLDCRWKRPGSLWVECCLRSRSGSVCNSWVRRGSRFLRGFFSYFFFCSRLLGSRLFSRWLLSNLFSGSFFSSRLFGRYFFGCWRFSRYFFSSWLVHRYFFCCWLFSRYFFCWGLFCGRFFCSCHNLLLDQVIRSLGLKALFTRMSAKRFRVLDPGPAP